jgi:hypothetical protein
MIYSKAAFTVFIVGLVAFISADVPVFSQQDSASWVVVTEDDHGIKIETEQLEAVIPKKNPKQWMTGIEKGSFVDKATGFHEIGDGSDAVLPVFNRHSGKRSFEFQSALSLSFYRNGFSAGLCGFPDTLACENELIPPHTTAFVECHHCPPFFACFLPVPFGRPPRLPFSRAIS